MLPKYWLKQWHLVVLLSASSCFSFVIMARVVRRKDLKAKQPARDLYRKLRAEEIRLARMWHPEDDREPSEIAALLRRNKSTLTRLNPRPGIRSARAACVALVSCCAVMAQLLPSYCTVTAQLIVQYLCSNRAVIVE